MVRYMGGRILGGLAAIFGASIIAFVLMRLLPGNPARLVVGPLAPEKAVYAMKVQMGLTKPIPVQYWDFISQFFEGRWGYSYSAGASVSSQIGARLPATVELGVWAFIFAFLAALIGALASTYRRRPGVSAVVRVSSFIGLGTPAFWLGLVLLLVFSSKLGWLPGPNGARVSSGIPLPPKVTGILTLDSLIDGDLPAFGSAFVHLLLPAISLGFGSYALLVRLLRSNLLEVGREPFLLVTRSKGLSRWGNYRKHALPNAFLPTLTASGLVFATLIGSTVLVESTFDWPGIGQLVENAILRQDDSIVQVFIMLSACAYVAINVITDLLCALIDPRIRLGTQS